MLQQVFLAKVANAGVVAFACICPVALAALLFAMQITFGYAQCTGEIPLWWGVASFLFLLKETS